MLLFKRIGTVKRKFRVEFVLDSVLTNRAEFKGQVSIEIKRGSHKVESDLVYFDDTGLAELSKELLLLDPVTMYYDDDEKKYVEKPGEIRVVVYGKDSKKVGGTIAFDLAEYLNKGRGKDVQCIQIRDRVFQSKSMTKFELTCQIYIRFLRQTTSEAESDIESVISRKKKKADQKKSVKQKKTKDSSQRTISKDQRQKWAQYRGQKRIKKQFYSEEQLQQDQEHPHKKSQTAKELDRPSRPPRHSKAQKEVLRGQQQGQAQNPLSRSKESNQKKVVSLNNILDSIMGEPKPKKKSKRESQQMQNDPFQQQEQQKQETRIPSKKQRISVPTKQQKKAVSKHSLQEYMESPTSQIISEQVKVKSAPKIVEVAYQQSSHLNEEISRLQSQQTELKSKKRELESKVQKLTAQLEEEQHLTNSDSSDIRATTKNDVDTKSKTISDLKTALNTLQKQSSADMIKSQQQKVKYNQLQSEIYLERIQTQQEFKEAEHQHKESARILHNTLNKYKQNSIKLEAQRTKLIAQRDQIKAMSLEMGDRSLQSELSGLTQQLNQIKMGITEAVDKANKDGNQVLLDFLEKYLM